MELNIGRAGGIESGQPALWELVPSGVRWACDSIVYHSTNHTRYVYIDCTFHKSPLPSIHISMQQLKSIGTLWVPAVLDLISPRILIMEDA